jgi:L-ascorbate metabolism protein UlaG (beta-lactamase superfamily)
VRFPVTGPVRYSMTAREAVQLCRLVRPRTAIPVHYEGWTHFHQGRTAIEQDLEQAPADIRGSIRWLPLGQATVLAA